MLEAAKLVEIVKGIDKNRSLTVCRITSTGRKRYLHYLETLEQVVRDAAQVAPAANKDQQTDLGGLAPSRA